jgi:predicted transcriptional regulator
MPTNADRFLDAFKAIEDHLRRKAGATERVDFTELVAQLAADDPSVRTYQEGLVQYARLRNAIVHHASDHRRRAIAEPRPDVVEDIEAIRLAVTRPPRLGDVVGGKVTVCLPGDPIRNTAKKMAEGDFSQLPVYQDGKVIDLLTSEAIAFWMARRLAAGQPVDGDTPVADVATADEDRLYRLVDRTTTVVEALEMFDEAQAKEGRMLQAIVVMRSAASRTVTGIATVSDMPKLLMSLRPRRGTAATSRK